MDAGLYALGLWLALTMPVALIGGTNDDFHYVSLATGILDGRWLGPFDHLTLATGAFYPIFLALAAALSVPIQVATHGVYLLGSGVVARAVRDMTGSRVSATFCLALLVMNPVPFAFSATALMREPLYDGLTLLVIGLAARSFLCPSRPGWRLLLGVAAGLFWLTREEGVVLLPALCLMAIWCLLPTSAEARRSPGLFGLLGALRWSRVPSVVLVPMAGWLIPVLSVAGANHAAYGVFRTNDFQDGPFPAAYGALSRIVPDHWQRFIPVPRDARLLAYAVSPATRELQPFLEGHLGRHWTAIGCQNHPVPSCNDMQAGWFIWALRDAVAAAGHYGSAREADRFYRDLAHDIDEACDAATIPCFPARSGYLPPFRSAYLGPFLDSLEHVVHDVLVLGPVDTTAPLSTAEQQMIPVYRRITLASPTTPPRDFADDPGRVLTGWFVGRGPKMKLSVAAAPGMPVQSDMRFHPDPGLVTVLKRDASIAERFAAQIRCFDCVLELSDDQSVIASWPVATIKPGWLLDRPDAAMLVGTIDSLRSYAFESTRPTLRSRILSASGHVLSLLTRIGLPAAMLWIGWITVADIRRRRLRGLTILALATAVAIAGRMALLTVLDATSFPTQFRYEAPALTLSLFLISLMLPDVVRRYLGVRTV